MAGRSPKEAQLLAEVTSLRQRLAELENLEARRGPVEEALARSEKQHRRLIEIAPVAILATLEGRIEFANPAAARLFGASEPEELIGRSYLDLVHPDDRAESLKRRHKILEEGWTAPARQHRCITLDGQMIEVESNATPYDLGGQTMIQTILRDITERKRAEEALQESEERSRLIFDQSPLGTAIVDLEGGYERVNRQFERFSGYSSLELAGMNYLDLTHPEDRETSEQKFQRLGRGKITGYQLDKRFIRKDGQVVWGRLSAQVIRDAAGQPIYSLSQIEDITARKRAEEALRESEEKHRTILENMEEGYYEVDLAGNMTFFNEALCRMSGYSAEELLGKNNRELATPQEAGRVYKVFKQVYKTGLPRNLIDYEVITKTGEKKVFGTSVSLVRDRSGKPVGFRGVMRDVTEPKKAEEELRRSERKYRELVEALQEGIWKTDREAVITFVNPRLAEMLGYAVEEMIGRVFYDFLDPERLPIAREKQVLRRRGISEEHETVLRRKDGSRVSVLIQVTPLFDEQGDYDGSLAGVTDITARKKAEKALQESEKRYRDLFENAPYAYFSVSPADGSILDVNRAAENLTRYDRQTLLGLKVLDLYAAEPDGLAKAREVFQRLQAGESAQGAELLMKRRDGSPLWVSAYVEPIKDEQGRILASRSVIVDISDRKGLEEQLRQAQKMEAIGTLAGGIAHDFNNILAAIIGYTELAAADLPEDHAGKADLDQVYRASLRAKKLIEQILSFSRQSKPERKPVRIGPIVKEALRFLRASLPTTIEIKESLEDGNDVILADVTEIHQLLMNLAMNAAQAMAEKGGTLEVRLERVELDEDAAGRFVDLSPGPHQRLSVSDTGTGMDQKTMARIFEPFFTTKEPGMGTGMGLAVAHGIVKGHGGAIKVTSQPGLGSYFEIYLPLREKQVTVVEVKSDDPLPMGRERVLFVDDESALADIGRQVLERLGYLVTSRTSSLEALNLFKARPDSFDLVITDQTMPQMTGAEMAREMLEIRPDLPIILCTGFSEKISAEKARAIGIRRFVMKPIVARQVAAVIREVLDQPARA